MPAQVTEMERRSLVKAVMDAGMRRVTLVEQAIAAAIGEGSDIGAARGTMIVDIGAGNTGAVVLTLKGVAASASQRVGGSDLDDAFIRYMRTRCGLAVGLPTARRIREGGASAMVTEGESVAVRGREVIGGLPRTLSVTARQVREAHADLLLQIGGVVHRALENAAPELLSDILDNGIALTGGMAQMKGMADWLSLTSGVPCHVADEPARCAVKGACAAYDESITSGIYDINQFL